MYSNSFLELSTLFLKTFCRLASAYEDKVLNNGTGQKKLHRTLHNFSAFVDYVLDGYKKSVCYQKFNTPCSINVHWRPYNARCLYCDIDYNVIGRMETFDEDVRYIFLKANLTEMLNISELHIHKSNR